MRCFGRLTELHPIEMEMTWNFKDCHWSSHWQQVKICKNGSLIFSGISFCGISRPCHRLPVFSFFSLAIGLGETRWYHYSIYSLRWERLSERCLPVEGLYFHLLAVLPVLHFKSYVLVLSERTLFHGFICHSALGRPTLLCSTWCGLCVLVAKVAWCCG